MTLKPPSSEVAGRYVYPLSLSILRSADGRPVGKQYRLQDDGWHRSKSSQSSYLVEPVRCAPTLEALSQVLHEVSSDPSALILRDTPSASSPLSDRPTRRRGELFQNRRSHVIPLDLDGVLLSELDGVDLEGWSPGNQARDVDVVNAIRRRYLPAELQTAPAIAMWSASTGWRKTGEGRYKVDREPSTVGLHLWFIASEPVDAANLKAWCELQRTGGAPIDPSLYHRVQPVYVGAPTIIGELPRYAPLVLTDPPSRMVLLPAQGCPDGWFNDHRDTVPAHLFPAPTTAPPRRRGGVLSQLSSPSTGSEDEHLTKRLVGLARAARARDIAAIASCDDSQIRHSKLYAVAHRLAGFAAAGLLDWNQVRAELEAVGTSGTEKLLRHAEDHPDDVSPALQVIRNDHAQKRAMERERRPKLNQALQLPEARAELRALTVDALQGSSITALCLPPGIGKTTTLLSLLADRSSSGVYVFASPNRAGAVDAMGLLRSRGARAELWVGRSGPKLYNHQTWERPGLQGDAERTIQTCASESNLGRLQAGYRALCGRCPFREQCSEGEDSLHTGYLGAQRLTRRLIGEGAGVIVTTQDMLSAVLRLIDTADARASGIVIDEEPRLKTIELGGAGVSKLTGHAPELGRELGSFLQTVATVTALEDREKLKTADPLSAAILTTHGRGVTSRYQPELRALADLAGEALPELEEAEKRGELSRPLLAAVDALASRPGSLTVHTRLGHPSSLQTLSDRPELPSGVPVVIADATADRRRIEAWSGGRSVEVHSIRLRAHKGLRALLIDGKCFQRGKLGADKAEPVARCIDRLMSEMSAPLSRLARARTEQGLPLSGLLVAPRSLYQTHPGAVDALQARLTAQGWSIAETHWQSVESRGSNRFTGIGTIITLGSPLMNLSAWMVQERMLAYWLADFMPADDAANDPESRERHRWQRSASAESWQAHNRARAWTDPDGSPFLHIAVGPTSSAPAELRALPVNQRDHLTLQGRPSTVGTWVDRTVADLNLSAAHPGLLSRLPGAPNHRQIRAYLNAGGPWKRSRVWSCALTGGGSSGRTCAVHAPEDATLRLVAESLERLGARAGLSGLAVKTLTRDSIRSFDRSRMPQRKQPPRSGWSPDAALRVDFSTEHQAPGSTSPPPVKANHSNVDGLESMTDRRVDESLRTVANDPARSSPEDDSGS
jgi:hypothetical protein